MGHPPYDAAGNLTSKKDFNGHTTTYAYDTVNWLLSKTADVFFSAGACAGGACGATSVSFTYTATRLWIADRAAAEASIAELRAGGPAQMSYSVKGNEIEFAGERKLTFEFPVGDVLETKDAILVRLQIPPSGTFNENIFAFDHNGKLLWQVKPTSHSLKNSPYVGLSLHGSLVRLQNVDGMIYDVEPATGKIIRELLAR